MGLLELLAHRALGAVHAPAAPSTDQVADFGGGTKRSMGKKLMASQLEELYEKVREAEVR